MNGMKSVLLWSTSIITFVAAGRAGAADVLPPASERFKSADVQEVPDFQRHHLHGRISHFIEKTVDD